MSSPTSCLPQVHFMSPNRGDAAGDDARLVDDLGLITQGGDTGPCEVVVDRIGPRQDALLAHAQTIARAYRSRHSISASENLALTLSVLEVLARLETAWPLLRLGALKRKSDTRRPESRPVQAVAPSFSVGPSDPICLDDDLSCQSPARPIRASHDQYPEKCCRCWGVVDVCQARPLRSPQIRPDPLRQTTLPVDPTVVTGFDRRVRQLIVRATALGVHDSDVVTLLLEGIEKAELVVEEAMQRESGIG
ncbi:hypothetical protein [Inquilinus sp. CA228]|uniref:hypothetical protein n=1 Tax=Inquilinus sp. CA228 TaxID=3455609 RepID=UPI003F8D4837